MLCLVDNVFECKFDSDDCSTYVNIDIGGNNIMKWDRINNGPTQSSGTGPSNGSSGGMLLIDPYIIYYKQQQRRSTV